MGKIVMATIDTSEDLEIRVKDVQHIGHVPESIVAFVKENFKGRKLNKNGLPSVTYLGANRVKVVGAVRYGDIAFLDVEGKISTFEEEDDGLVCITAYRPDKTYEQLMEGKQNYLEEIKKKYPNGLTVEEEPNEQKVRESI